MSENRPGPDEVWQALNRTLYETVQRSRYAGLAPHLRQLIATRHQYPVADRRFIEVVLQSLYASQGQARMRELAGECGVSLRQFERRFKQLTGLSPKLLARLIRFEAVRVALLYQCGGRLHKLASHFGYTDEAHLNHDFKILAGCSPGQFVAAAVARGTSGIYISPDPRRTYSTAIFNQSQ